MCDSTSDVNTTLFNKLDSLARARVRARTHVHAHTHMKVKKSELSSSRTCRVWMCDIDLWCELEDFYSR